MSSNRFSFMAATLVALVAALFLTLNAGAATVRISQEPGATTMKGSDIFLIDQNNGDGTYTTKTVSLSNLGLSGQNIQYVTNLYTTTSYVTNQYVTFDFVSQSFITNLYVTTEIVTNLTVYQTLIANKSIFTNVTIINPGGFTNLNLLPNALVMTDPNDNQASLTNNSAYPTHALVHGLTPPSYAPLSGNDLLCAQSIITASGTNFDIDLSTYPYVTLNATNNINFRNVINGGPAGSSCVKIFPGGADRLLTFPTNWIFLRTNWLTKSGSFWTYTLTNATGGNGPRIGWLSVAFDGISTDQTNVVALFQESP